MYKVIPSRLDFLGSEALGRNPRSWVLTTAPKNNSTRKLVLKKTNERGLRIADLERLELFKFCKKL